MPAAKKTSSNSRKMLSDAPKVIINVHKTGQQNETSHVFVGVNGVGFNIERGTDVVVPKPVADTLQNCVETEFYQVRGENGMRARDRLAHPFSVIGPA